MVMEKVKIFAAGFSPDREVEINAWLTKKGESIEITRTTQAATQDQDDDPFLITTIFYKEKKTTP